jgi:hypothetical protein
MRRVAYAIVPVATVLATAGCTSNSSYSSVTSDAGVALIYEGKVSAPLMEQWFGTIEFGSTGCLELWPDGYAEGAYTAALPAGSTLADDGTLTVNGYQWKPGKKAAFSRVQLENLDEDTTQIPAACADHTEVFAVVDVQDVPADY